MPSFVTPPHLAKAFADSTPEQRHDLVRGLLQSIRKGEERETLLARAEEAGWPREFAAWIYTKVKQEGEIEILSPLDERVRKAKLAPPLIVTHAPWIFLSVLAFVGLNLALGGVLGLILVPSFWGLLLIGRKLFARRETGDGEWITPR